MIVVQGLGFVGAVMSLVCANAVTEEYAVIGVDLANEFAQNLLPKYFKDVICANNAKQYYISPFP